MCSATLIKTRKDKEKGGAGGVMVIYKMVYY